MADSSRTATHRPVPLSSLPLGARARLYDGANQARSTLLRALGLSERSPLEVCKTGNPWIVKVRSTRIGLTAEAAAAVLVVPEEAV